MRNPRILAASAAAVAVLGLAAPVALADGMGGGSGAGMGGGPGGGMGGGPGGGMGGGPGGGMGGGPGGGMGGGQSNLSPSNIVALPSVIARGGQLTVTVDNCPRGGTMTSAAFPTTTLTPINGANHTAKGTATVNSNARPGPYDITVTCTGTGSLTRPAAFTVIGGVRGGLGGGSTSGATPTDMAIGGGLVAAALVGGGVFWMRRRAERRA
ncbi:hypothetical protein [Streptomyces longwoodensis]|uniref:hypothetical protein n=1 Tax=Streptomyces longwoodensis TaxID=68231 RepID=UPI003694D884